MLFDIFVGLSLLFQGGKDDNLARDYSDPVDRTACLVKGFETNKLFIIDSISGGGHDLAPPTYQGPQLKR